MFYLNSATGRTIPPSRIHEPSNSEAETLSKLLNIYTDIERRLEILAEQDPNDADNYVENQMQQFDLLESQAKVVERFYTKPITTLEDAKMKIALWRREVIENVSIEHVSASDLLAKSIFDFLQTLQET